MNTLNFELLNTTIIQSAIEPHNLHLLRELIVFESIDSTNNYLLTRAREGALSGTVCLSESQTDGRGRQGRKWFSYPRANILCSVLWRFSELKNVSGLSLAIGMMLANVLQKYGISTGIQLKWPNDVLFNGRKIAGILLERQQDAVVIGIGLNIYLPPEADSSWIGLQEISSHYKQRNYLAGLLINELLEGLPLFERRGLEKFLSRWQKFDYLIGKSISVQTPQQIFSGTMLGVNEKGELILENETGVQQFFSYGEVSSVR